MHSLKGEHNPNRKLARAMLHNTARGRGMGMRSEVKRSEQNPNPATEIHAQRKIAEIAVYNVEFYTLGHFALFCNFCLYLRKSQTLSSAMSENNKPDKLNANTPDTESLEERLERNWKKITEERERERIKKINKSLTVIPVCILSLFIIDSINFNPDIFFFLPYLIGGVIVFHFFRIIFLFPDTNPGGPWFI